MIFRLRDENDVLGYMKINTKNKFEFSKDLMWWESRSLKYDLKDQWSGFKDKNNRLLFEHDIIFYRNANKTKQLAVILYDYDLECFYLYDIDDDGINFSKKNILDCKCPLFYKTELSFYSYLFLNKTLMEEV